VGQSALDALAAQLRLEEDNGATVSFTTSSQDVTGSAIGPGGYPTDPMAKVFVRPSSALADDKWYALRLQKVPFGLSLPKYAQFQTLPDGSPGIRFSPGSHARPAAIRVCDKGGGETVVMLDWSERVLAASDAKTAGLAETTSGSSCPIDPMGLQGPSTKEYRFLCQGLPAQGATLALDLDAAIKSASGGTIEAQAAAGHIRQQVSVDTMTVYGQGCRIVRPW
jgi:hypothetical protein